MTPGVEVVGAADAPKVAWFLHGILGRGRNWRSFARRLVDADPSFRALLVDLRCHGESPPRPGPHTLAACAGDLAELALAEGDPDLVVSHSFGGKVALTWLSRSAAGTPEVWVLDSPPGLGDHRLQDNGNPSDPAFVLPILRSIPTPVPERADLRRPLVAAGVPEPIVAWLLTSARQDERGWSWVWDLGCVEALLEDYLRTDLWPFLATTSHHVHLVRAGRSDRWAPGDDERPVGPNVRRHLLPNAGHWVHVDDPDGTFALITGRGR